MKRLLFGSLAALALAVTAAPARAAGTFEYSCSRHLCWTRMGKCRCFSYNSRYDPMPGAPGYGYGPPVVVAPPYAAPPYGYAAAPVAAAPAAVAPAVPAPAFKAPQPTPATNGVQQAGYFYYGPTNNAGYNYNPGYNYGASYGYGYGYGYGASYAQVPNYWY